MSTPALTRRGPRWDASSAVRVRRTARWHPEWWLFVCAIGGWTGLLAADLTGLLSDAAPTGATSESRMPDMTGHAMSIDAGSGMLDALMMGLMWVAMIAIMAPLIGPNVRFAALRSPARRRFRATVEVVLGWSAVWALAAVLLAVAIALLQHVIGTLGSLALLTALTALWQGTAAKRGSVALCHRTFAPPLDPHLAARACRGFGARLGVDCVWSCGPLMALMAAGGHGLLAVGPLFWVTWYERRRRPHHDQRATVTVSVVVLAGAAMAAAAALGLPG